jgi:hypothetical protein
MITQQCNNKKDENRGCTYGISCGVLWSKLTRQNTKHKNKKYTEKRAYVRGKEILIEVGTVCKLISRQ